MVTTITNNRALIAQLQSSGTLTLRGHSTGVLTFDVNRSFFYEELPVATSISGNALTSFQLYARTFSVKQCILAADAQLPRVRDAVPAGSMVWWQLKSRCPDGINIDGNEYRVNGLGVLVLNRSPYFRIRDDYRSSYRDPRYREGNSSERAFDDEVTRDYEGERFNQRQEEGWDD